MHYKTLFPLFLFFLMPLISIGQNLQRYVYESPHMGTMFRIVFYASSDSVAEAASEAAFRRVQVLNDKMSDYDEHSELTNLSRSSGQNEFVSVSPSLFYVLQRAQEVSRHTRGAFDITVGPYVQLWRSKARKANPQLPDEETLCKLRESVGFQNVELNEQKSLVRLNQSNMQLDLGGIAKGYAADEILEVLRQFNITSVLADAGGDIALGDPPPDKKGWSVIIRFHKADGETNYKELILANKAITTSGDLFQSVEIDGKRYSHIIDPGTGLGLTENITVTVIAPDGITADGYASALSVLGLVKGAKLVEQLTGMEAFFEYSADGSVEHWQSPGFEDYIRAVE